MLSQIKPTFSPKKMKMDELRSSYQYFGEYKDTNPDIYDVKLSDLPKDYNIIEMKKLCEGMHVISSNLEFDALTGECKGEGKLSLRCHDQQTFTAFEENVLKKGLKIEKNIKKAIPKSYYWEISNVPLKEFRVSRTPNPDYSAYKAKINEQLSSVFGTTRKFTPVRQERDKSFQAQLQWKKTKNSVRQEF